MKTQIQNLHWHYLVLFPNTGAWTGEIPSPLLSPIRYQRSCELFRASKPSRLQKWPLETAKGGAGGAAWHTCLTA